MGIDTLQNPTPDRSIDEDENPLIGDFATERVQFHLLIDKCLGIKLSDDWSMQLEGWVCLHSSQLPFIGKLINQIRIDMLNR